MADPTRYRRNMDVYMNDELKKSGTLSLHIAADAVMGEEGGWEVPVSYGDAAGEAKNVRSRAGIFDISHLGRVRIRGNGALDLLERVCTHDVARQEDDTAAHTLLCNERGGIIDECFLLRLSKFWVLTTNAGNREKVIEHLKAQQIDDVKIDDQTEKVYQFAVSGPAAQDILRKVLPISIDDLADGGAKMGSLMIANYIATRVSYSGEWTLEVMVPGMFAGKAWEFITKITKKAGENAVAPVGMAARDILRIEAGRCRYGHEINEMTDPVTGGLMSCVELNHDFIGADAIAKLAAKTPARRRVGLILETSGGGAETGDLSGGAADEAKNLRDLMTPPGEGIIPTLGTPITTADAKNSREVGNITSGTFSPKLGKVIAMGYVAPDVAEVGTELIVHIPSPTAACVTALPFVG